MLKVVKFKSLYTKKTAVIAGAVVVVVIVGLLIQHYSSGTRPTYKTVLPDNKSISELGGWRRVSPPGKDAVFAYDDNINGISISVSQQPLPPSFKTETASHVADLAKAYNATTKIDVDGTTVYIGTSSKGPQSIIFTAKNLLILIKSQKVIDNGAWGEYVKSLGGDNSGRIPKY
jgi:hypothetical protein